MKKKSKKLDKKRELPFLPCLRLGEIKSDIEDLVGEIFHHSKDFTEEQLQEKHKEFYKLRRLEQLHLTAIFNNWKFFDFNKVAIETGWLCRNDYDIFEELKNRNEQEDYDNYSKKYYKKNKTVML